MAEGGPLRSKNPLKMYFFLKVSPEERAKQFKGDMYADDGVLFCKYCDHSVDYVYVDTG